MSNPNEDIEQLGILSIFHYILGSVIALFSCLPLIHVIIGVLILVFAESPAKFLGLFFLCMGLFVVALGWTLATCILITARKLSKKTKYKFCFAIACIECVLMPFGTILGIFTLIALNKASVKAAFNPPYPAIREISD